MSSTLRSTNLILFTLLIAFLSGCVQTTYPKQKKVDKKKSLESYITLGMAYLDRNDRDSSRRNFERALEIDGGSHEAHNGMGLLYELNGELELAEKSFKRSIREKRDFTQARVNYGVFLYRQQRYQEAYGNFEAASEDLKYDRRALVLAYVGQAAQKLNNGVRAKSAFEHAVNIDNQLPLPIIELAQISFDAQDYAAAKNYLDQYTRVSKPSPKSLWLGIRIERIFGNKDKEASYALALRNLHPYSKEYLEYKKLLDQQVR
ncbi:MAG: type IV pilus biogenesis/stability protein PilW [Cellvibrionaceae bacterium]